MYPKAGPIAKVERYNPTLFNMWLDGAKTTKDRKGSGIVEPMQDQNLFNRERFVDFYLHKIDFDANELITKCQNMM